MLTAAECRDIIEVYELKGFCAAGQIAVSRIRARGEFHDDELINCKAALAHLERKVAHHCTDAHCPDCDGPRDRD